LLYEEKYGIAKCRKIYIVQNSFFRRVYSLQTKWGNLSSRSFFVLWRYCLIAMKQKSIFFRRVCFFSIKILSLLNICFDKQTFSVLIHSVLG
jgi:hypothetical protein